MGTSKSTHIEEKVKFLERLYSCSPETRKLFSELKVGSVRVCDCQDYGYTDKPDFRLANSDTIICELVPSSSTKQARVLVMLRVDDDSTYNRISPSPFTVSLARQSGKPGLRWVEFEVCELAHVTHALRLIEAVYKSRSSIGWLQNA